MAHNGLYIKQIVSGTGIHNILVNKHGHRMKKIHHGGKIHYIPHGHGMVHSQVIEPTKEQLQQLVSQELANMHF